MKNKLYAGFTKSATLTNGKMVEEGDSNQTKNDSSSEDEEMDKFSAVTKLLSDETLFKEAGITAHKGARHGKYLLWSLGLWNFQTWYTKLVTFQHRNQHPQRKF